MRKGFAVFFAFIAIAGLCAATATTTLAEQTVQSRPALSFNAVAYVAGHGGHLAVVDLRSMKAPVDAEKDRIVVTGPGTAMEGVIAGVTFDKLTKPGGVHGQALVTISGRKSLVAGTLSGDVYRIDLASGDKQGPVKVGQKFCGAVLGPDGKIHFEDMADGHVYSFDARTMKTVNKTPVGKAICGIQWTKNGKKAYITDMTTATVYVYDWPNKERIKEISSPEMTFIHQARMTPDGAELWVSAPNEYDPGLAPPRHRSQIVVIDTKKDEITRRIVLPDNSRPHDFAFSKDGKYAILASRTNSHDSVLQIMDRKDNTLVTQVSACSSCHDRHNVKFGMDNGASLLGGLEVDWNPSR